MNKKERIENAVKGKSVDRIPWTMYQSFPPWGETELSFRNEGLSMIYQHFPACSTNMENVKVEGEVNYIPSKNGARNTILRKFITPLGEVSVQHEFMNAGIPTPGDLIQKFGSNIDQEELSWITKFPLKDESHYDILKYIYENTTFSPNYDQFLETEKLIGSEGIVMASTGKSPFQMLLYELMGPERCYFEYQSNPGKFRDLYDLLYQKQIKKYEIAANSPATVVWSPENTTSSLTPPNFFKEFCLPFYNEVADILHEKGKVFAIHMDGLLNPLLDLIAESKIDVIEAFTPPPMGDLPISKARKKWKNKAIWMNFPGSILANGKPEQVKDFTVDLLRTIAPGDRFLLGCTENYPVDTWEVSFGAISKVLKEYGNYPIKI